MTRITTCMLLLLISLTSFASASIRHLERDDLTGHIGSTREEVLAKRERRKSDFTQKLGVLQQKWEDHMSGVRPLKEGFETDRLMKKIKAYQNKLEYLNEDIDERHIERLLGREELLNEVHRNRIIGRSEL